jgi:hypothetical protein
VVTGVDYVARALTLRRTSARALRTRAEGARRAPPEDVRRVSRP